MEKVAVIGASPREDRYSNKAMRMLKEYNHTPVPVAPRYEEIEGEAVYQRLEDIPEKIDTVTMYIGPKRQDVFIDDIIKLAPRRVIFNPGTENREAEEKLKGAGIEVQEACTLVLLRTNQY